MVKEFTVTPVLNGFIVKVGCQTVVFTSVDSMIDAQRQYLKDPDGTEELFIKGAINPSVVLNIPPISAPVAATTELFSTANAIYRI